MYINQVTQFIPTTSRSTALSRVFHHLSALAMERLSSYRQKKAISKLSLHLKYDAGLLDIRPTREMLIEDTMKSRHTTLEDLWLRYR